MKTSKTTKVDGAGKTAERIREWWVGKGCTEHSDKLRDFATKAIRSLVRREVKKAVKVAVDVERKRVAYVLRSRCSGWSCYHTVEILRFADSLSPRVEPKPANRKGAGR